MHESKQAKCPKCKKRTLRVEYTIDRFATYVLLENGMDGECVDESGGDADLAQVFCLDADCGWENSDTPEEFVESLMEKKDETQIR